MGLATSQPIRIRDRIRDSCDFSLTPRHPCDRELKRSTRAENKPHEFKLLIPKMLGS